ncbi:UvrD-helicase domain-containing protein [Legionella fairfieldensis]|uniref:UvrD-helicase domain-containing protein n=1 Tax=Legionella fairfieldensis TaxID=45064 RepID=UPI00048E4A1F|nr:UvrD-helicase domain-containing protein [Legionella fairfieldensis]
MLKDSQQRAQATDPHQSFIVQAPAGSGKTEILTQRFLRLLNTVKAPEQIIALTFTRKAASEMRERILSTLQNVAAGAQANSAHQAQTYRYAAEALRHSQEQGWQILKQPGRLRIVTIDSLCQTLSQAIPLQDRPVSYAQISDNPLSLYQEAARACLAYALDDETLHPPLKHLLEHLDNRQDKLLDLLSSMLANREQWLPSLYTARERDKTYYEQMLAFIEQHELMRFQQSIPADYRDTLCFLARQMACIEADPESSRYRLRNWQTFQQMDRHIAASLSSLLLTSENKLRKSFDHRVGLKRGVCDDKLYDDLKTNSKALFAVLDNNPEFLDALLKVKNLPPPDYNPEQWRVLQALFILSPLLVAHLQLIFNEKNEVDFSEISQQALLALGDEEHPTDLALYMDNTIHHLLIDEFQDTSIQQFQLISKLVQGWQADDGKTLFIVGDPMQSIYRFRQAEVGLFLKARQEGIGPVHLAAIELCCNFRSAPVLVNWVNNQFKTIFPHQDDIESGAISFHPSTTIHEDNENSFVKAWQFPDSRQEAHALVELTAQELANNPNDHIAILVRSRSQLSAIIAGLREREIPFQGVEIELLSTLPHLRDIWSLTQALLLPANRLAWLALLRSPFCGLSLPDLYQFANFDKKKSIYHALSQANQLTHLSEDGRCRAQFIHAVLQEAFACRYQHSLVNWIRATLKRLHADHILDAMQQNDLEQFWLLLDRFSEAGQLSDWEQFKREFNKLYSRRVSTSRLQVMTIHKSKGLEFDCVILPGLSNKTQNRDNPLLRWLKLPSKNREELLLVSPIKAAHHEQCLLYDYLTRLDAEKEGYELQRLLYVATTRAKKRLYLFDNSDKETKGSFRNLLKNQAFLTPENQRQEQETTDSLPLIQRLPIDFYLNTSTLKKIQAGKSITVSSYNNARQTGIVAHELLQWICNNHPPTITELPWSFIRNRFKSLGFTNEEQETACNLLYEQINQLLRNPVGQWLIKAHIGERNEFPLLINEQNIITTRIIDRTFIEEGKRWIIDFKTGSEDEKAQDQHRQQVNDYARLLTMYSSEPIHCGLYYLASGNWVEWNY